MIRMRRVSLQLASAVATLGVLATLAVVPCRAEPLPSIADKTEGLDERRGLLDLYVDRQRGKVFLKLPPTVAFFAEPRFVSFLLAMPMLF